MTGAMLRRIRKAYRLDVAQIANTAGLAVQTVRMTELTGKSYACGRQDPCVSDTAFALGCQHNGMDNVVCINGNIINKSAASGGNGMGAIKDGTCYTLTATYRHAVVRGAVVRRLTPRECERLQGMPDDHTRIPWRGKPADDCPDGQRYKAIGNSMAVPVMRWIGERMRQVMEVAI